MANKNIDDLPTATSLNAGDKLEILQGGTNKQIDASLLGAVQSVTGPQVDDTDPNNPIVNPLGLIKIVDLNGDFFTDLATASAYVATFNVAGIISDESYNNGVYYFTVPQGSDFSGADYFLSLNTISSTSAYIVDENKLISFFGDYAFKNNEGNNTFSASLFGVEAFALASGINVITDSIPAFGDDAFNSFGGVVTFYGSIVNSSGNYFGQGATGKFIILGSPLSCDATLFMAGATSTILVDKYYYTNNAGDIDACLANAITEGCNVQFDGINLVTLNTNQTLTNKRITARVTSIVSSSTPTVNTDNCDAVDITALAASITSMTSGLSGTPTNFQKLIIRIKDNGTARAIAWGASYASMGGTLPTTTVLGKVTTVGLIYNTTTSIWGCVAVSQEV